MERTEPCDSILIVDDDDDLRETMADLLTNCGYVVAQAANGAAALDRLRHTTAPAVIILDMTMPVMNGAEFRNAQLRDKSISDIPVIVLTSDPGAKQKAREMHAADGLCKPVCMDALLNAIHGVCVSTR